MVGAQRTGKFTELAIKQAWCAVSCAAKALDGSLAALIVMAAGALVGGRLLRW